MLYNNLALHTHAYAHLKQKQQVHGTPGIPGGRECGFSGKVAIENVLFYDLECGKYTLISQFHSRWAFTDPLIPRVLTCMTQRNQGMKSGVLKIMQMSGYLNSPRASR